MEGETETEIRHCHSHYHHGQFDTIRHAVLIRKENYHPMGDFICDHCKKPILCKTSVYTCDARYNLDCEAFFLHKNCADLPLTLMHASHTHLLQLLSMSKENKFNCSVCDAEIVEYRGYNCETCTFKICLKCAVTPLNKTTIQHWSHPHRPLRFVERLATFECDACNKVATESSYMCDDYTCSFWIHQSCATLPQSKLFIIHHKHPLLISDSLPEVYRQFRQFCKICQKDILEDQWLYYCPYCRFFAHIRCALSTTPVLRHKAYSDPKLMQFPTSDEGLMNFMMQKWIKDTIYLSVGLTQQPPSHVSHWAHGPHPLALKNKSALITTTNDDLNQESERLITCAGCTKPISSSFDDSEVFYECSKCNYSLHRYCAQFPQQVHHPILGMLKRFEPDFSLTDIQSCYNCNVYSNGLMFKTQNGGLFDVWCVCQPQEIIHVAHHHPLKQYHIRSWQGRHQCKACHDSISYKNAWKFCCESCDFSIHQHCALRSATINHRWDPHPLHLVLSLEDDIEDHPHDFECEFCSEVIDTNNWFYHCKICDLSLHLDPKCMYLDHYDNGYSNIKFGATNINIEAHEHDLTMVLNRKKAVPCTSCRKNTKGLPILQCKQCSFIRHFCCNMQPSTS